MTEKNVPGKVLLTARNVSFMSSCVKNQALSQNVFNEATEMFEKCPTGLC